MKKCFLAIHCSPSSFARILICCFFLLSQRCSWTPVGLGALRLPVRLFASCKNLGHRPLSWYNAKPVTRNSALPAKQAGTPAKGVQRLCPFPSCPGRPGTMTGFSFTVPLLQHTCHPDPSPISSSCISSVHEFECYV